MSGKSMDLRRRHEQLMSEYKTYVGSAKLLIVFIKKCHFYQHLSYFMNTNILFDRRILLNEAKCKKE